MARKLIRLTESELNNIIVESVKRIISEGLYDDVCLIRLISKVNGNLLIKVPFREFMATRYKNDYIWELASEQYPIKQIRNGYFVPERNSPHYDQIKNFF